MIGDTQSDQALIQKLWLNKLSLGRPQSRRAWRLRQQLCGLALSLLVLLIMLTMPLSSSA